MKLNKLSLLLLATLSFSSLTSCFKEDEEPYDPLVTITNNATVPEVNKEQHELISNVDDIYQGDYQVVDESYAQYGLLVIKNQYGRIGFYSITHQKFIVNCSYYYEWLDYEIKASFNGFVIKIDYENISLIIDNFGNVLYEGDELNMFNAKYTNVNDKVYLTIITEIQERTFMYDNGNIYFDVIIPEIVPEVFEPEIVYDYNDIFLGGEAVLDLTNYGLLNYTMIKSQNGLMTVFGPDDKCINTFFLDHSTKSALIGTSIIAQNVYDIPIEISNYDYYANGLNHIIRTKRIDILTGKEEEVKFNYVLNSSKNIKDIENLYNEAIFDVTLVSKDKVLTDKRSYLVDKDLNIIYDYTGQVPTSFIKIETGYFNEATNIIYSKDFKVVSDLNPIHPRFYPIHQVFIGRYDGKYGIVDTNSRVRLPFIYDEIVFDDSSSYFLARIGNDYSLRSIDNQSAVFEIEDAKLICADERNNFYSLRNNETVYYFTLDNVILQVQIEAYDFVTHFDSFTANDYRVMSFLYRNKEDSRYYLNCFKLGDLVTNVATNGQEVFFKPDTGKSFEDTIKISLGTNMVHANPTGNYTYLEYYNQNLGYYRLDKEISETYYYNEYDGEIAKIYPEIIVEGEEYLLLEENTRYYFKLQLYGYDSVFLEKFYSGKEFVNGEYITSSVLRKVNVNESGYYSLPYNVTYSAIKRYSDSYQVATFNEYHYDERKIIYLDYSYSYYFMIEPSNYGDSITLNLNKYSYESIKDYSYLEEIQTVDTPTLRKFTPSSTAYYTIDSNASTTVYYLNYNNNLVECDRSYRYDGKDIYRFSYDNIYIFKIVSPSKSTFEIREYNYENLKTLDKSEYLYNDSVRKFSVNESGYYGIFTSSSTSVSIYKVSGSSYSSVYSSKTINNDNLYQLDPSYEYFAIIDPSYGSTVDIRKYSAKDIDVVDSSEYIDTYNSNYNYRRFEINETGYYTVSTTADNYTIYHVSSTNQTETVYAESINGSHVYKFIKDEVYIIGGRATYYYNDSWTVSYSKLTFATLPTFTSGNKRYNYNTQNVEKYVTTDGGYYTFRSTNGADLIIYDSVGGQFVEVEAKEVGGAKYYNLAASKTYIIYSHSSYNSYYVYGSYYGATLPPEPQFTVTNNSSYPFEGSLADGYFRSTNHNSNSISEILFTVQKAGTFSFNYDISSESRYDTISLYVDNYSKSLSYTSGSHTNVPVSLTLSANQTVKIRYSKDSSQSYGSDDIRIYNIVFLPNA